MVSLVDPMYQNDSVVVPLDGMAIVCAIELSPLYALRSPTRAQYVPVCELALRSLVTPLSVQPPNAPSSKPPFTTSSLPPVGGGLVGGGFVGGGLVGGGLVGGGGVTLPR